MGGFLPVCINVRMEFYELMHADACIHGWRGASRHASMQGDVRLDMKSHTIM